MKVYYGDALLDRLGASPALDDLLQYEALNLVDGKRSVRQIRDILSASYEEVSSPDLLDYFRLLEKAGLVTTAGR